MSKILRSTSGAAAAPSRARDPVVAHVAWPPSSVWHAPRAAPPSLPSMTTRGPRWSSWLAVASHAWACTAPPPLPSATQHGCPHALTLHRRPRCSGMRGSALWLPSPAVGDATRPAARPKTSLSSITTRCGCTARVQTPLPSATSSVAPTRPTSLGLRCPPVLRPVLAGLGLPREASMGAFPSCDARTGVCGSTTRLEAGLRF
jgi:hypothetical protein